MAWKIAAALVCLAGSASAHFTSTFDDIQHTIFDRHCATSGCHASGAGNLWLREGESWGQLVLRQPSNTAAADNLKFRIDPGRPWNSYLVDRIRGRFKTGEDIGSGRMPPGSALTECEIREIERWILAGAPEVGYVEGDRPGIDPCDPAQPSLDPPPDPGDGVLQVHAAGGEVTVSLDAAAGYITAIEVFARAGTEHVTITAAGGDAPIMVARVNPDLDATQTDTLQLPVGFGIPMPMEIVVRQAFAGERFQPAGTPEAWIRLHLAETVARSVEPFMESLGADVLFVPPRSLGVTGGLWSAGGGAEVAALRVWADPRAVRAFAATAEGIVYQATAGEPEGYVVPESPLAVPPGGISYACEHDNTHLLRQLRWGCGEATVVRGQPVPPPGRPGIVPDGVAAPWCDEEIDCSGAPSCVPANLVGGSGAEDGRCALVGLRVGP